MRSEKPFEVRWRAVAVGWMLAVLLGICVSGAARWLYATVSSPPLERGLFTSTAIAIAMVSGYVAYLPGGYAAARLSGGRGGLHGAMTAVFGSMTGLIAAGALATAGIVFVGAVALPPTNFGLSSSTLLASLALFVTNLLAGYAGGKLGESPGPDGSVSGD